MECSQHFVTYASRQKILLSSEIGTSLIEEPEMSFKLKFIVSDFQKLDTLLTEITKIFEIFTNNDSIDENQNLFYKDEEQTIFWKICFVGREKKIVLYKKFENSTKNLIFSLTEFYLLIKGLTLLLISSLPIETVNDEKSFLLYLIKELSLSDFEENLVDAVLNAISILKQRPFFAKVDSFSILSKVIFYADFLKNVKHLQLLSNFF